MSYLKVVNILNPSAGNIAMVTDILGNTVFGGNVGIGTGGGNISFNGSALVIGTQNALPIQFRTSGTQQVVITSGGNVGIATTNVTAPLHVFGTNTGTGQSSQGTIISRFMDGQGRNAVTINGGIDGNTPSTNSVLNLGGGAALSYSLSTTHAVNIATTFAGTSSVGMLVQGLVGIGTTSPSYQLDIWNNGYSQLQLYGNSNGAQVATRYRALNSDGSTNNILTGVGVNANNQFIIYDQGQTAALYQISNTSSTTPYHQWFTGGSERVRIDAGGNVGIGISATLSNNLTFPATGGNGIGFGGIANNYANIWDEYSSGDLMMASGLYGSNTAQTILSSYGGSAIGTALLRVSLSGYMAFYTNGSGTNARGTAYTPSERMRITPTGNVYIGQSTSIGVGEALLVYGPSAYAGALAAFQVSTNASGYSGIRVGLGSNGNNTSSAFYWGNNNVANYYLWGNGTSTFSSDMRLKKNIETTRDGYLEDLCKLRVVKYNWKNHEDGTPKELGLIAQEVEEVFEGLVQDDMHPVSDDDPTIYKQLKITVLPVMLLKALQELKAELDSVKAELALIKGGSANG
jgi:Chaperone of endosialidase